MQKQQYVPKPPTLETVREFLIQYPDFGIRLVDDTANFEIHGAHGLCLLVIKQLLLDWCNANMLNVIPRRNQFNRFEAGIFQISTVTGQPFKLCSFTHEDEGEACFRAILLYEQMKRDGTLPTQTMIIGANNNEGGEQHRNGKAVEIPSNLANVAGGAPAIIPPEVK